MVQWAEHEAPRFVDAAVFDSDWASGDPQVLHACLENAVSMFYPKLAEIGVQTEGAAEDLRADCKEVFLSTAALAMRTDDYCDMVVRPTLLRSCGRSIAILR